jgi:hypothetical protein
MSTYFEKDVASLPDPEVHELKASVMEEEIVVDHQVVPLGDKSTEVNDS